MFASRENTVLRYVVLVDISSFITMLQFMKRHTKYTLIYFTIDHFCYLQLNVSLAGQQFINKDVLSFIIDLLYDNRIQ